MIATGAVAESPRTLAQILALVVSKHMARRNQGPGDRAEALVRAQRAAGMEFAERGGDRTDSKGSNEPLIDQQSVAADAQVSESTAKRAIADQKRQEAPPAEAGEPVAEGATDSGSDGEVAPADTKMSRLDKAIERAGVAEAEADRQRIRADVLENEKRGLELAMDASDPAHTEQTAGQKVLASHARSTSAENKLALERGRHNDTKGELAALKRKWKKFGKALDMAIEATYAPDLAKAIEPVMSEFFGERQ